MLMRDLKLPYGVPPLKGALAAFFVFAVLYFLYLYVLNRTDLAIRLSRKGYHRCPHYQHRDVLFGSDFPKDTAAASASGTRKHWVWDQFDRYGKTFETKIWGRLVFQTCDPLNIQSLLTKHGSNIGVGPSRAGLLSWLGPGAFTVDGEMWRRSRDMLKPVFRKTAISDMSRLQRHLVRLMHELEREGLEVDLQNHFLLMFLDLHIDLIIGEDVNTVNKDFSQIDAHSFMSEVDKAQLQVVRSTQQWLMRWYRGWTQDWDKPLKATHAFIERFVDSAMQDFESSKPDSGPIARLPAFLDEIIRESGSKDKAFIRDQVLNVFMPGRDSVAIMISHVMFYLSRHPTVYAHVRAEVIAAGFEHGEISYDAIKKDLPYPNAVIQESLRIGGPPNGITNRDVLSDIVLPRGGGVGGDQPILVPRGSIIEVQIQALHRDEVAWGPDPHVFRPERWVEMSKSSQRLGVEYMPFGGGRRTCPAMGLVMGELAYMVAFFAARFREIVHLDPRRELLEEGSIVMKIRDGLPVKLVK